MAKWELRQGYGRGMTVTFLPGLRLTGHDVVEAALQMKAARAGELEVVHVSSDAYDIIEHCVRKHWPGYVGHLRYGLFTITADHCRSMAGDRGRDASTFWAAASALT